MLPTKHYSLHTAFMCALGDAAERLGLAVVPSRMEGKPDQEGWVDESHFSFVPSEHRMLEQYPRVATITVPGSEFRRLAEKLDYPQGDVLLAESTAEKAHQILMGAA